MGEVELEFQGSDTYNTLYSGQSVDVKIKCKSTNIRYYNEGNDGASSRTGSIYGYTASGYSSNSNNEYLINDTDKTYPVYWENMRDSSKRAAGTEVDTYTLEYVTIV